MDEIYSSIMGNPEACREEGKRLLFDPERNTEERRYGFKLLDRAMKMHDPEASYIIGTMLVEKRITAQTGDSVEYGLSLLCLAADRGFFWHVHI